MSNSAERLESYGQGQGLAAQIVDTPYICNAPNIDLCVCGKCTYPGAAKQPDPPVSVRDLRDCADFMHTVMGGSVGYENKLRKLADWLERRHE